MSRRNQCQLMVCVQSETVSTIKSSTLSLLIMVLAVNSTAAENAKTYRTRDFDDQAAHIINSALMGKDKLAELDLVRNDIERALQTRWPEFNLQRYGSTTTGLGLKSSDADFYFALPDQEPLDLKSIVNEALQVFEKQPELFGNFSTKHPPSGLLLNLVHLPTGMECDVNFHVPYAVRQSQLIAYLLHSDKRALKLANLLKIWGSIHGVTGCDKKISSYSVTLLLVFYLQQKGILPSIALLQKNVEPNMIGNWNVAFNTTQYKNKSKESLYSLLGGFFKYYSAFDFNKYVISTHIGDCIERVKFATLEELPNDLSLYKTNILNNKVPHMKITEITIQNIFVLTDNTMIHKNNTDYFKSLLKISAKIYNEVRRNDFLGAIFKNIRIIPEIMITEDCTAYNS